MDRLWAPWRSTYVSSIGEAQGCFLCAAADGGEEADALVIARRHGVFALMNLYPYNNGHILVAPGRHLADLLDLNEDEMAGVMALTRDVEAALKRAFAPDGFNIGLNLGRAAGAGHETHLHMHIVPRWYGDSNYMPVIGGTKVLPMSLEDARDAVATAMEERR